MSATEVIRRHGDHIEMAARAGYVARGIVFAIIGTFAFKAAYTTGQTMGSKDAVSFVFGTVGGKILLLALVAALAAFAAWRWLQAIRDVDGHGSGAKGIAIRAGLVGSGISYAVLALFAGALAWGSGSSSGDGAAKGLIARAYEAGWGQAFTYTVAALMVVVGAAHVFKGIGAGFETYMTIPPDKKAWVKPVCQFGLIARGFTYLLLAYLLGTGAASYRDGQTPGLETALDVRLALRLALPRRHRHRPRRVRRLRLRRGAVSPDPARLRRAKSVDGPESSDYGARHEHDSYRSNGAHTRDGLKTVRRKPRVR